MTTAAVSARIAQLDEISRLRALTDFESNQLARLIVVERRYNYSRNLDRSKRAKAAQA